MTPSDSLHLDEHLARLLAAYDQGIGDGEVVVRGPTLHLKDLPPGLTGDERLVEPLSGSQLNQGSFGDLLPDPPAVDPFTAAKVFPETHRIGRFELRRQLGKGGCGIVFLAFDPKLRREVALKIPRPELLMSPDARRRLHREATAAAGFDHPNLVPVYETGEIGPVCFIATVFCPGQTLSEWLDRQSYPVPIRQAARLVAQLAEAVQHAHDRSVLHRDLKPNNVILQEVRSDPNALEPPLGSCPLRGEYFTPRVVDFGLAKFTDQGPSETVTRQILGTPKYMAPEQAQARHEDVGPEADVYALGVILYEMLVGRTPYEGASDVEVLRLSIEGNLTLPRNLRREIPRDLEAICLKAMARSPSRRYRMAIDFADDLRRFLEGLPTLARPLNAVGRAGRWLRRNDQAFALVTVSTISCILLAIGMWNAYQTQKYQVVRNESQVRDAERTKSDAHRSYSYHVRNAFLAWRSGDKPQQIASLHEARLAAGTVGEVPEFAWGYLSQVGHAERSSSGGPAGKPLALAVSTSGAWLATGYENGTLAIWNREATTVAATAKADERAISHIAFLSDSRIATASGAEVRVWTVGAKGEVQPGPILPRSSTPLAALVSSSDGKFVYCGTATGECECWNFEERRLLRSLKATNGPLSAIAVSGDGKRLATGGGSEPVRVWEPGRDDALGELAGTAGATHLAYLPDGMLAVARPDGSVRFYDGDRREVRTPIGSPTPIIAWSASPNGSLLAVSSADEIVVHNALAGTVQTVLRGRERVVRGLGFSPDSRVLFSVAEDGAVNSWNVAGPEGPSIRTLPRAVRNLALRPESQEYAVSFADGSVEISTARGAAPRRFEPQGRGPLVLLRYPEVGPPLGVELRGNTATVWEFGEKPRVAFQTEIRGTMADYSPISGWLAVGDERGQIKVWSVADRELKGSFASGLGTPVRQLAFSDSGRWLVAPTADRMLGVWYVSDPVIRHKLPGGDGLWLVRFLGDDRVITTGRGSAIRIWHLATIREEASLLGHVGRITALAVSPDFRTLVSGGANGETKLWDLRTGQEVLTLERHAGAVLAAEFSSDGRVLITGGAGSAGRGELAFWDSPKE